MPRLTPVLLAIVVVAYYALALYVLLGGGRPAPDLVPVCRCPEVRR
jgi:hypothetical protein